MSTELAAYMPSDPRDADRWSRLLTRLTTTRPSDEALEPVFTHPDGPTLERLLATLADDPYALAEDHALQAWEALDVEDLPAAHPHWEAARALAPNHPEVLTLDAVMDLGTEARAARLQEVAGELRAALGPESLAALTEGEGQEDVGCLRLHRCLREWAYALGELDRPSEVVALATEVFSEAGADTFGLFPLFVHAALQTEDLEALETWAPRMGLDSPALMHWLQAYLFHRSDQPGAAFQSLRRARKVTSGVDRTLFQWETTLPSLAEDPDGIDASGLPFPEDPASAAVVRILGFELAATPPFMAWLRKMRALK